MALFKVYKMNQIVALIRGHPYCSLSFWDPFNGIKENIIDNKKLYGHFCWMEEELSLLFPNGKNSICEVRFKNYETKEVKF